MVGGVIHQIAQTQDAETAEIRSGILALETDISPLAAFARGKWLRVKWWEEFILDVFAYGNWLQTYFIRSKVAPKL